MLAVAAVVLAVTATSTAGRVASKVFSGKAAAIYIPIIRAGGACCPTFFSTHDFFPLFIK